MARPNRTLLVVLLLMFLTPSSMTAGRCESTLEGVDQRLQRLETKYLLSTFDSELAGQRIERLEKKRYGKTKEGSLSDRLKWLEEPSTNEKFAAQIQEVRSSLAEGWKSTPRGSLKCVLTFWTDLSDTSTISMVTPSGDSDYDAQATRAVKQLMPLTVPGMGYTKFRATFEDGRSINVTLEEDEVDFEYYMTFMQRKIKRGWVPPRGMESKRVKVQFKILRDGSMRNFKIIESAGVDACDVAASTAVRDAAPFAMLPAGSPDDVDIQFTFDYNVFAGSGQGTFKKIAEVPQDSVAKGIEKPPAQGKEPSSEQVLTDAQIEDLKLSFPEILNKFLPPRSKSESRGLVRFLIQPDGTTANAKIDESDGEFQRTPAFKEAMLYAIKHASFKNRSGAPLRVSIYFGTAFHDQQSWQKSLSESEHNPSMEIATDIAREKAEKPSGFYKHCGLLVESKGEVCTKSSGDVRF